MKNNKGFAPVLILVAVLAVLAVGGVAYYAGMQKNTARLPDSNVVTQSNLVGGDKDVHGCIGSAGYTWCAVKNKCLRVWEEKCEATPTTPAEAIKFTFPTAGTALVEGQTYNIAWTNSGVANTAYVLYLVNDQAGSINIGETKPNQNSLSWKVPSILSYLGSADNYDGGPAPVDGYRISIGSGNSVKDIKQYFSPVFKIISTTQPEKQIGYIKSISLQNGIHSLVIDYVQKVDCKNDSSNSCPNGYKIVNDNALLRTLPISSNVQVKLQTYSHTTSGDFNFNQVVPLSTLINALNNQAQTYPAKTLLYGLTLNEGVVIEITEQYQP